MLAYRVIDQVLYNNALQITEIIKFISRLLAEIGL